MDFQEFFKKKRIDLAALEKAEPGLFSEFKAHYELMGEKSFDHTKKYWFNKLRRQYPFVPEVKTEKVHIANPVAEQTITESLIESAPAQLGFVPKFKGASTPKPPVSDDEKKEVADKLAVIEPSSAISSESPAKPAYKPRFVPPKPKVEEAHKEIVPGEQPSTLTEDKNIPPKPDGH